MQAEAMITGADPEWLALLKIEVAKDGQSVSSVAARIGMPRPSLSLLVNDTYPARLDKVGNKYAAKVLALLKDQLHCPHLRKGISLETCRHHAGRPMSTNNPERMSQFMACRACPQNPISKPEGTTK
jgi:hypothetical protein